MFFAVPTNGIKSNPTDKPPRIKPFLLISLPASPTTTAVPTNGTGLIKRLASFHPAARAARRGRLAELLAFCLYITIIPLIQIKFRAQLAFVVGRQIERAPVNFKRRDFALAVVYAHHIFRRTVGFLDVDFFKRDVMLFQKTLRVATIAAPRCCVHLDICHFSFPTPSNKIPLKVILTRLPR